MNRPINRVPEAGPMVAKSVRCALKRDIQIITRACFIKVRVADGESNWRV